MQELNAFDTAGFISTCIVLSCIVISSSLHEETVEKMTMFAVVTVIVISICIAHLVYSTRNVIRKGGTKSEAKPPVTRDISLVYPRRPWQRESEPVLGSASRITQTGS